MPEINAAATADCQRTGDRYRFFISGLIPLAAFGLQYVFWSAIQPYAWLLFYPAVFFSSWVGGLRGGLLATGLSTGLVWYFFIPPQGSFAIERPTAFFSIGMFMVMGVLFSLFHERLRRANQQAAEAARRAGEDQFRAIFEQAAAGMAQVGLDGRWLRVNSRLCDIVGHTREELAARTLQDLTHPDDVETDRTQVRQVLAGELQTYTMEKRCLRKDRGIVPVSLTVSVVRAPSGQPAYFILVVLDITLRRQAEAAAAQLAAIVQSSDDAIIGKTLDGIITSWNAGAEKILGHAADEMIGCPITRIIPPDRQDDEQAILARIKLGESVQHFETVRVKKDGGLIDVSVTVSPIKNARGEVVGASKVARNITERKQAEMALQASRGKLEAALASMTDAVFISDAAGHFIEFNDAFATFHRFKNKAECAKTFAEYPDILDVFLPNGSLAPVEMWAVPRALRGETATNAEYSLRRKDTGETWVGSYSFSPIRDAQGQIAGSVVVGRDITGLKQAAEKIKRTVADLERSNKELEHFAYVASHDLQEPLRMVASYTQLLAQQYESRLDDKARKFIRYAVDGAVRMQTLINDLLTYSRVGRHGKPLQPTDSHAVLGEAIRNLATAIMETHAVITSDDLPLVLADASQLVQLFQNLLANAIKFQHGQPPRVHLSARADEGRWRFAVQDNGIGIEAQYAERVFIIFQRLHTREEYPGTGIGLAVCQRIVDRHGGKIWFASQPGNGTTFFFTLPVIPMNTSTTIL